MHYIADAASHLAEHPDAQHAQYAMHGAPQEAPHHHAAVHQDAPQAAQQEYAGVIRTRPSPAYAHADTVRKASQMWILNGTPCL